MWSMPSSCSARIILSGVVVMFMLGFYAVDVVVGFSDGFFVEFVGDWDCGFVFPEGDGY